MRRAMATWSLCWGPGFAWSLGLKVEFVLGKMAQCSFGILARPAANATCRRPFSRKRIACAPFCGHVKPFVVYACNPRDPLDGAT